ncbi:MAG TPA: sensor histidine kinase [Trueperaceae bacterium]
MSMPRLDLPRAAPVAYIYLIWLLFLFSQPIFDPQATWLDWALVPLMIAIFLPVYFYSWTSGRRGRLLSIAVMSLLGLLFVPLNSGAGSFFIYASAAVGFALPPRRAAGLIVGILLLVPFSALYSGIPWPYTLFYLVPVSLMVVLIGTVNIFEAQRERANSKLRRAQEEIENLAKIAERERIARDLHDLLGHTLSTITLKAELASRLVERDLELAVREMRDVEDISRQALAEVRAAVRGYRSRGIRAELASVESALEAAGIRFVSSLEPVELPPVAEGVLVLALREGATNVVRHSAASSCQVTLSAEGGIVRLTVEDDGRGMQEPEGSGLTGMHERVESLGGSVEHGSGPGVGTRLVVTLPSEQPSTRPLESREAEPTG